MQEEQDHNITKPDMIAAHLSRLQREHHLVKINIADTTNSFNSMIVDVDAEKKTMLLDVLHPDASHQQMLKHKKFSLNVDYDGVKIGFKGAVKKVVTDDDKPAYLVDFPDTMLYQQRRQAFRAPIAKDMALKIILTDPETNKSCEGIIDNVSRDGLCLQFDHTEKYGFDKFKHVSSQFLTTENIEIVCEIEIRNIMQDSVHRYTKVGVKFINLDKQQKRHIQNFSLKMERQMMKRKRA